MSAPSLASDPAHPSMIYLPDTMSTWPWPRRINSHYDEVSAQSDAWFRGFGAFTPKSQHAFDKCNFGLLSALGTPSASKEHLRTSCDLNNLYFLIDEYTDVESGPAVRQIIDAALDALNNPHKPRPQGEIIIGEVTRQFWALALETASPTAAKHFVQCFSGYLESVVEQAQTRDSATVLTLDEYMKQRTRNVGVLPLFVLHELAFDLPDGVFYHPVINNLRDCVVKMLILDNDMLSYNKEQAVGDDLNNILTIAMQELNLDLQAAIAWACARHAELRAMFLEQLNNMPVFGADIDMYVQEYVLGIANWARGYHCWQFEGGRYLGDKGLEVQRSRQVRMLPKVKVDRTLKRENVVVQLVDL
ncbi:isoprenoid synthase domain-containing protein [Mycena rebaudengoi]|nr:isoprenoid synthase domain-containing protein [Mycena rebaudengoi]